VHNKIEHEKHLLRTVVLIKVLVDTRATGCITQQLRFYVSFVRWTVDLPVIDWGLAVSVEYNEADPQ
jgi:hypothetical protein